MGNTSKKKTRKMHFENIAVGGKKVVDAPEPSVHQDLMMKSPEEAEIQMETTGELPDDSTASTAASVADVSEKQDFEPATPYNSEVDQPEKQEFEHEDIESSQEAEVGDAVARICSLAVLTKNFACRNVKNFIATASIVILLWFPLVCVGFWISFLTFVVPASRPVVRKVVGSLEFKMARALGI